MTSIMHRAELIAWHRDVHQVWCTCGWRSEERTGWDSWVLSLEDRAEHLEVGNA